MNHAQWRTAATSSGPPPSTLHSAATAAPHARASHMPVMVFKTEPDGNLNASHDTAPARRHQSSNSPVGGGRPQSSQQSQLLGKPILQSCQFCRKRKIKCDKLDGGCTQCVRAKTECIYPASQRKGRPRKAGSMQSMPAATPREEQLLKKIWKLETIIDNLTGRGGQGALSNLDEHVERPLKEQLDRLVVGKSYVSDTFWADDSVDQVTEDSEDFSEDDEEPHQYSTKTSTLPEIFHSNFIFGIDLAEEDLSPLHPPTEQIPIYWELYVDNCEKILAMFHKPTTFKIVKQAHEDVRDLSKANEALMFSLYFATINSLSSDDVGRKFGADKGQLLTHYENAIQRALVRVGFLSTQDLTVLQAFVLYLICIRHTDGAIVWSMTGLAIRLSQGMNIDRDGELFHLSPLQTEIRRRLWHQIAILDVRASEAKGLFPTPLLYDTKIPRNINDDDISAETREYAKHRDGVTEMTIAVLRYETGEIGRRLRKPGLTQETKEKMVKDFYTKIDQKYLRYCREVGGLYSLSNSIANVVTSRMLLMIYKNLSEEKNEEPGTRHQLFQTSTELLEHSYDIHRHPDGSRWNWLFKAFVQWHGVNIVLSEIIARVPSTETNRAWRILDLTYPDWEVPHDRANKLLYMSVQKLLSQALEFRAAQQTLHEQQYNQPEGQQPLSQPHSQPQHLHPQAHGPPTQQPSTMSFTPNVFAGVYNSVPLQTQEQLRNSNIEPHIQNPANFFIPQQSHSHSEMYVNQGTGIVDDSIGIGTGVAVTQDPRMMQQQAWYVPVPSPQQQLPQTERTQGQAQAQLHPMNLEDANMAYEQDDTWHSYDKMLKNYSIHGRLG